MKVVCQKWTKEENVVYAFNTPEAWNHKTLKIEKAQRWSVSTTTFQRQGKGGPYRRVPTSHRDSRSDQVLQISHSHHFPSSDDRGEMWVKSNDKPCIGISSYKIFQMLINICLVNGLSSWDKADVATQMCCPWHMSWKTEAEAALKKQKESLSARNALRMRIPKRSSREKLCLNPEKAGYIYWHSKHLCFCRGDKRETASLPRGMIYGLPRHWVWAAVEGTMQRLMDEGWGNSLGHTLIKIIKLPWLVEQNANAILHVDVKGKDCLEETNLFVSLPWSHLSKLVSVLLPRSYVSQDWQGSFYITPTHDTSPAPSHSCSRMRRCILTTT